MACFDETHLPPPHDMGPIFIQHASVSTAHSNSNATRPAYQRAALSTSAKASGVCVWREREREGEREGETRGGRERERESERERERKREREQEKGRKRDRTGER